MRPGTSCSWLWRSGSSGSLRAGDTAARFGGDEFAILLEATQDPTDACEVAERVIADLRAPITVEDREVQVHASIGIAFSKRGAEDASEILQAADVAMYAAKARGKNRYEVYQPALQAAMASASSGRPSCSTQWTSSSSCSTTSRSSASTRSKMIGVEALVRWEHPERGLLPPKDFIPLAEETGLIIPMSRWVLEEACTQTRKWQLSQPLLGGLKVSVNISARQFQHDGLLEDVSQALQLPASILLAWCSRSPRACWSRTPSP